jgi:streptogramin lyase
MLNARRTLIFGLLCCVPALAEHRVDSVAGTGKPQNNGDAGHAPSFNVGAPFGVEIGPDKALYITEVHNHRVLRLDLNSKQITTVAGCGLPGYAGDGGPAAAARLYEPYEVRFDHDGNMIVVEMKNHVVRRIDKKTKTISTIAGTGRAGYGGDGGPATAALLNQPHSIAVDDRGAVYVADIGNHRIRRIDPHTGMIESIAGNSQRVAPRDGQHARGNPILGPRALCIDGRNLWIALREGHSVWRLNLARGTLHHVAGTGEPGFAGDGGPAPRAQFNGPKGIAVAADGDVFIVDSENNAIRAILRQSGRIVTIMGPAIRDGRRGEKTGADPIQLNQPHGICIGPGSALYIGDTLNHRVLRVQ